MLMEAFPELSLTEDLSNTTALHTAANQGHIEVVNLLLESGSGVAAIAKSNGKTALHSAARNGHLQVIQAILDKEPGVATRIDKKGQTALHMAVKGQSLEVVEELMMADPFSINMIDTRGNTALHIASRKGREQVNLTSLIIFANALNLKRSFCIIICPILWCIGSKDCQEITKSP